MAGVRHRERDVGDAHRAQAVERVRLAGGAALHLAAEADEAFDGQGGHQRLAAGEVAVGCRVADAGLARQLPQRQRARPRLGDDGERRVEQRAAQIAVVISLLGRVTGHPPIMPRMLTVSTLVLTVPT